MRLLSFLALLPAAAAQTDVGCDPSCPPLGFEADSSHLCPGDAVDSFASMRLHDICHPTISNFANNKLSFDAFRKKGYVTVIANYYTGCEAGRRESGVYAGIAQRIHDATGGRVNFVTSLKGGGDCSAWASIYQADALSMGLNGGVRPSTMPLTIGDGSLDVRDFFFTPPYPHPSYIVLDENLEVTYKSVGPCCGYVSYYDCTDDVALGLDGMLTGKIYEVYNKQLANPNTGEANPAPVPPPPVVDPPTGNCASTTYSEWSACSKTCGDGGIQFRYSARPDVPVETQPCPAEMASALPACAEQCVPELGTKFELTVVASDLASPRDLAFHPSPGVHLGSRSEGRDFYPDEGEELWVANGGNHSVSIIASLGTDRQTTISRLDRGYYHYMNNVTALAFNTVAGSGRNPDQDTYNFFAVCNDNLNDYVGSKEANYFMGPTLYDTDTVNKPGRKNTVTRLGDDCSGNPSDQCFFLHADMLHESPACVGIAHDPEVETSYGAVYWAFDTTGDNSGDGGQLVRFDFSQPHGPGSMDHSIASVRRYPDVKLYKDETHGYGHAGMVVHPEKRVLFVANPGTGSVSAIHIDTGKYSRTAREEYPIFSNRLPSFEYSIYSCVDKEEAFAEGLDNPSGLALSSDGTRLFVAERGGQIVALEVESGEVLQTIDLQPMGYTSIGGLAVSPETGALYFVDMDTNKVVRVDAARSVDGECAYQSRIDAGFQSALESALNEVDSQCGAGTFSLTRDYGCEVDGTIPAGTLFEQVHTTGYASDDPNVQSMAGMDAAAAALANRTDCGYDSELNFDALLLGGYYCHVCLPRNQGSTCDPGGVCANVQWRGFTCDNEYHINRDGYFLEVLNLHMGGATNGKPDLSRGVTYRFTVQSDQEVCLRGSSVTAVSSVKSLSLDDVICATNGPILVAVGDDTPSCLYLTSPGSQSVTLTVDGATCPEGSTLGLEGPALLPPKSSAVRTIASGGLYALLSIALASILLLV